MFNYRPVVDLVVVDLVVIDLVVVVVVDQALINIDAYGSEFLIDTKSADSWLEGEYEVITDKLNSSQEIVVSSSCPTHA